MLTNQQRKLMVAKTISKFAKQDGTNIGPSSFNYNELLAKSKNKTGSESNKLKDMFFDDLKTTDRDWSYLISTVHTTEGKDIYYNVECGICHDFNMADIEAFIVEAQRDFVMESSDGNEKAFYWIIAPSTEVDWNVTYEFFLANSIERGLLGDEYVEYPKAAKLLGTMESRELSLEVSYVNQEL